MGLHSAHSTYLRLYHKDAARVPVGRNTVRVRYSFSRLPTPTLYRALGTTTVCMSRAIRPMRTTGRHMDVRWQRGWSYVALHCHTRVHGCPLRAPALPTASEMRVWALRCVCVTYLRVVDAVVGTMRGPEKTKQGSEAHQDMHESAGGCVASVYMRARVCVCRCVPSRASWRRHDLARVATFIVQSARLGYCRPRQRRVCVCVCVLYSSSACRDADK